MIWRILFFWFLAAPLAAPLAAQGFAGLGTQSDGFAVPQRGVAFDFPADHGAHPDYRIEWWYLTATLEDAEGTPYGLQWTLFRSALAPRSDAGWNSGQNWMGHAAVTTPEAHYVSERRARGGIGQAGIRVGAEFDAWIDDWHLKGASDLAALTMRASGTEFAYDMQLQAAGPLVFQGDAGYSVKSEAGQASYYYSQPFFKISGSLTLPDGPVQVAGQAWLDREWSSQPLAADQTGWDWFSLSFDDGARMMGFLLRSEEGGSFSSATWIDAEGTATPFENGAFRAQVLSTSTVGTSNVGTRQIPTSWAVQLPARGVDVKVRALNPQSWMETSVPYWDGPISIEGSHSGRGYLEMTGY
jgi:predicted secreted hydrolase